STYVINQKPYYLREMDTRERDGGTVASSPSLPPRDPLVLPETEMGHREG
ncbi:unnamed protein product, partial [Musa acuminata var. zebrina]